MRCRRLPVLALLAVAAALAGQAPSAGRSAEAMFLSLLSGEYREDQALAVEPLQAGLVIRYSFPTAVGAEGPWVRYRGPIPLTAAPGEERAYRVLLAAESGGREVERRTVEVRIDRRPPAAPRPVPGPGRFWEPVAVTFAENPAGRIVWGLGDAVFFAPRTWDGNPIVIGRAGTLTRTTLTAWSEDAAGNRSALASFHFAVDARPPELELQSPAPGTFANPQLLSVAFRNVAWIRYTTDGSDPAKAGAPYEGPVTISRRGDVQVRVAAAPRSGKGVIRREVRYTYLPDAGPGLVVEPASGVVRRAVTVGVVSAPAGAVFAALGEKTPLAHDLPAGEGIVLDPASGTRAVVLRYRCRSPDGVWGAEYRYVYVLAGDPPGMPAASTPPAALRAPSEIAIDATEDVLVFATLDGTEPGSASPVMHGAVTVSPPAGIRATVRLRAACMDASGAFSEVSETEIACDTTAGAAPLLAAAAASAGQITLQTDLASDRRQNVVYEIASTDRGAEVPTADSPQLPRPLLLTVPFGMERSFSVRCATVDEAGQVIAAGDPIVVSLDRAPPPRPAPHPAPDPLGFDTPLNLVVDSADDVRYSLTDDGRSPADPTDGSASAAGGIALPGQAGSRIEYRLKLIAFDGAGNASEVCGPFTYAVDLTAPRIPEISGIEQDGIYGSRRISPRLGPGTAVVRYTATSDGSSPPDPGPDSPVLDQQTVFGGEPGEERTWRVKLLAMSRSGAIRGEARELSFLIDLRPPEVPGISGFAERGRYATPVAASAEELPPETTLYLSWSESPREPGDPVAAGSPYVGPVVFDAPDGTSKTYVLRTAARDRSGNRSLYDRFYRFTVDREPPPDPDILDIPAGGVAAGPVTVSLSFAEGTARYEVSDDGSSPRLPDESSPCYESPLLLPGRPGEVVVYQVAVRAMDDLGNASLGARVARVTVDRTVPPAPPAPRLSFADGLDVAWLQWDQPSTGRILYRLRDGGAYVPYAEPVPIAVATLSDELVSGEAVAENQAGTRSDPIPFRLSAARPLPAPLITGVRDGAVVARRVELAAAAPLGELRCEVRADGGFPPTVTPSSPLTGPTLSLDVAAGETRTFTVAFRAFDPAGAVPPSPPAVLSFTIDRTPPDPPLLEGLEDGAFTEEARSVSLIAAEGAIYYSVSADGKDPPIPSAAEPTRYRGAIALAALPGRAVTYRILAFTMDPAGNRSRAMLAWSATVDQATVYTAPDGDDASAGTRAEPVRSLARALDLAARTGRLVVRLAYGEYLADSGLILPPGTTLMGGLERGTWAPSGLGRRSVIVPSTYFRSTGALLSAGSGAVTVSGIELRDGAGRAATLLSLSGTALAARDVSFLLQGEGARVALFAAAASIAVTDSRFSAERAGTATLAAARGGTMNLAGCTFDGPPNAVDFTCLAASGAARVSVAGSSFDPGSGTRVRGIRATASTVTLENCRISSGSGRIEAAGVEVRGGTLRARDCDFTAQRESAAPACLLAEAAEVDLEDSRMEASGQTGAAGVTMNGGTLSIRSSRIRGGTTAEYLYLIHAVGAGLAIEECLLAGGDTSDLVGILARDCRIDVRSATIATGRGRLSAAAIAVNGAGRLNVASSVLASPAAAPGPAVIVRRPGRGLPEDLAIRSCCFGGWERLIGFDPSSGIRDVAAIEALNGLDGDPLGGSLDGCIAEDPAVTFRGDADYRLSQDSACRGAGIGAAMEGE